VADRFQLTIPYAYQASPQGGFANAPTALPLLPGGSVIQGRDGRTYSHRNPLATLQALERDFRDYPMVLDENHALEVAAPNGEPSPGLARLSGFALRADGSLWATQVQWTDYGLQRIAQGAYVGVSPTVLFDTSQATEQDGVSIQGEILTLANAGLVNEPNFVMPALHSKGTEMNEEQIKKLIDDAVAAALAKVSEPIEGLTAQVADLGVQVNAMQSAGAQAAESAAASHAKAVEKLLERAVHARKIAPASRAYHAKRLKTAEDLEEFEASYLGASSEEAVSNERPAARRATNARASHDKDRKALARSMGISLEELAKIEKSEDGLDSDEDDQD
jgi:hypothetical protein